MSGTEQTLPLRARAYIALVSLSGFVALAAAGMGWASGDLVKFAGFLLLGLAGAGVRLNVPRMAQTLPLTFVFSLLAILELSASEAVVMMAAVMIAQSLWIREHRLGAEQLAFTIATSVLATSAAAWVFHAPWGVTNHLEQAIQLMATCLVLFLLNTMPIALAIVVAEKLPLFATWRECFLWSLPYYLAGAAVAQLASYATHLVGWPTVLLSGPVIYLIFRSYRLHVSRLEEERKYAESLSSLHLRTVEALAMAIEAKDQTTHDHLARVQVYCRELGKDLGLNTSEMEALRAASLLHDIGKLAVPEHIISKPGRLTPEEFEKMKIHPIVGAEILERVQFPYPVVPVVRAHHEKWDGSGYPYGLRGEQIPIGARILAAVDCLDALATDRQYRRALPLDEAMKVVQKESGKAFDPRIVDLLSARYVELEKMAKAKSAPEGGKLSTEVKIERGLAPAAGFEAAAEGKTTKESHGDFLTAIAAARQEVQALFEISQELGSSLSLDETLSVLGVRLRHVVPHHSLAIWVRRGDVLIPEFVGGDDFRLFSSLEIPVGQGLSGWVAENRKPILNGNPSVESGYLNDSARFSAMRAAIAVPLEGAGGVVGVLSLYHAERDSFTRDHLRMLLAISSKIGLSIENALRFRQAEASATTDYLTGLPNARSLFLRLDSELSRARREEKPLSVLVLDLDGFKQINDRFGHLEGNRVLRAVAAGLKSACRDTDCVARMGGDEFVVVLTGARPGDALNKVHQLRGVVSQVCQDMFSGAFLTASVGIANAPEDGSDAEQLLAEADRRMYKEKRGQPAPKRASVLVDSSYPDRETVTIQ